MFLEFSIICDNIGIALELTVGGIFTPVMSYHEQVVAGNL
jgi:hypothetical protein